ncbi:MAG: FHA domain-containing protein [Gammaproteobacteria bacterium]|nr:FHA domain-containing protein [Gammaproteobacteria bacterium]
MSEKINIDLGQFEGRTFKIGRDGHIYINSPMVSQQHAEIKIIRGRVYLRDLNSTNGTYLRKNNKLVHFMKGYVALRQSVIIGDREYTIQELLAIAGDFVVSDDSPTLIQFQKKAVNS